MWRPVTGNLHLSHSALERADSVIPDSNRYGECTQVKKRAIPRLPNRNESETPQVDESQSADTLLPVQERTVERDASVESSPAVSQPVLPP
jgi:hypothetical protein